MSTTDDLPLPIEEKASDKETDNQSEDSEYDGEFMDEGSEEGSAESESDEDEESDDGSVEELDGLAFDSEYIGDDLMDINEAENKTELRKERVVHRHNWDRYTIQYSICTFKISL